MTIHDLQLALTELILIIIKECLVFVYKISNQFFFFLFSNDSKKNQTKVSTQNHFQQKNTYLVSN